MAIIGILASVVLASLSGARSKGRDARRHRDIREIQNALELYRAENGNYPIFNWMYSNTANWDTFEAALAPYMPEVPHDPTESATGVPWDASGYAYGYFGSGYGCSGQWYLMSYLLETAKGPSQQIKACNGSTFQYGGAGANTRIKTVGASGKI